MTDWPSIDTAPKGEEDGDDIWILACRQGHKIPMVTTWDHDRECWYTFNLALESGHRRRDPYWKWEPTHWMPLPTPPMERSRK
jgi:hypothetical protein